MKITDLIAQHLLDVHCGDNWTEVNIQQTLQNITLKEALKITDASPNNIASLIHHISFWNRVMVGRIEGNDVLIPASNGFNHPELTSESDWASLQSDNIQSAHELAAVISTIEDSKLLDPILPNFPSNYKSLQGCVEHIHYHLGQIVIIKNIILKNEKASDTSFST